MSDKSPEAWNTETDSPLANPLESTPVALGQNPSVFNTPCLNDVRESPSTLSVTNSVDSTKEPESLPPAESVDSAVARTSADRTRESALKVIALRGLIAACVTGDKSLVETFIETGIDVNATSEGGLSPVVVATVNAHVEIVQMLIRAGATIQPRSVVPAIVLAGKYGHAHVVQKLLAVMGQHDPEFANMALLFAVAKGCTFVVKELLDLDVDINRVSNGLTPLIVAAEKGDLDVTKLLVQAGADMHKVASSQLTALAVAARNGHIEVVQVLIEAKPCLEAFDSALIFADKNGKKDIVQLLIQGGMKLYPEFGSSALRLAITDGCEDLVEQLLVAQANVHVPSFKGLTAILAASERGMTDVVSRLIAARAEISQGSESGLTPLVVASVNGHIGVVEMLLDVGADITATENVPAVVLAGKHGHQEVVKLLIRRGHDKRKDFYNFALLFAIAEGCEVAVDILVSEGADVNQIMKDGTTALMAAGERGCEGIVRSLLNAGADVNAVTFQLTALALASRNGHDKVVSLLLDAGAHVRSFDTALMLAGKNGHMKVLDLIVKAGKAREQGLEPELGKLSFCENALRLAISSNCECAVQLLLDNGTPVDSQCSPPPLMIASERGLQGVVDLLLGAGANPNKTADNGLTALVVAAVNGHSNVVKQLISAGGTVTTGDNIPAIVLAGKHGHAEVVDILIEAGQAEGVDFDRALLSAIVDDCELVVDRLLEAGVCKVHADSDMPLRLAMHQENYRVVYTLLKAGANLDQERLQAVFGSKHPILSFVAVEAQKDLHSIKPTDAQPAHGSVVYQEPKEPPKEPTIPSMLQLVPAKGYALDRFDAFTRTFKLSQDLPCLMDWVLPLLYTASRRFEVAMLSWLPPFWAASLRELLQAWQKRRGFVPADVMLCICSFTITVDNLEMLCE